MNRCNKLLKLYIETLKKCQFKHNMYNYGVYLFVLYNLKADQTKADRSILKSKADPGYKWPHADQSSLLA